MFFCRQLERKYMIFSGSKVYSITRKGIKWQAPTQPLLQPS